MRVTSALIDPFPTNHTCVSVEPSLFLWNCSIFFDTVFIKPLPTGIQTADWHHPNSAWLDLAPGLGLLPFAAPRLQGGSELIAETRTDAFELPVIGTHVKHTKTQCRGYEWSWESNCSNRRCQTAADFVSEERSRPRRCRFDALGLQELFLR